MFNTSLQRQPPAFFVLFLLEIWERFGYYAIQSVLILYLVRSIGFSDELAYQTFGAFTALIYGLVPVGGYLGDHVLGSKKTLVLGLVVLALGYLLLAVIGSKYLFAALGLICVGNGLFKANPATLLAKSYQPNDERIHSGFTLYYMAVNIGALLALIVGPTLSNYYGYSATYFAGFLGIVLALVNYHWLHHRLDTVVDAHKISFGVWLLIICGILLIWCGATFLLHDILVARTLLIIGLCAVSLLYGWYMYRAESHQRLAMMLIVILMLEAVVFFTLYQQMPTSLSLFAVNHIHANFFGIKINSMSFQSLNPTWIMICSPLLAKFYSRVTISIPYKFALGMTFCGISFGLLFFARYFHDPAGLVSGWWLVGSYFFQSLGELLVSALGLAMVAELAPKFIMGFIMGLWYLTSAIAGFTGAAVAHYAALPADLTPGLTSLMIYTKMFGFTGMITLMLAVILWITAPKLSQWMKLAVSDK